MMRLYRWLLHLYPPGFREEYGDELIQTLAEREADRSAQRFLRRSKSRAREILGMIRASVAMRARRPNLSTRKRAIEPEIVGSVLQDLRYAVRSWRSRPGFTAVIVLTLAIGIGANSSIFTLMDQLLIRALPVKAPRELVVLSAPGPWSGWMLGRDRFSFPFYRELRDENEVFDGVIARYADSVTLERGGRTERVEAVLVTGNYFDVLGVPARLGRLLSPSDDEVPGAHRVAVLSHRYWMSRFGGDTSILGESLRINGEPMTVVGVSRVGFHGVDVGQAPDLFVPMAMKAQMTPTWDHLDNRRTNFLQILARLRPGMTREQAEAGANVTYRTVSERDLAAMGAKSERFQKQFREKRLLLRDGSRGVSELREQFSTPLWVLMGMVGLVLLIACANVANLLLARSAARQKEVTLRLALGASRGRIVRQLLAESLFLSMLGGGVALIVSFWTTHFLLRALPFAGAARTFAADPDPRVMLFTFAVSVLTGLVFGLAPAVQATAASHAAALKDESVVAGLAQARFRKVLVIAQVALSLLLLTGAGLFARSLCNLRSLDPGFDAERLLTFSIDPSLNGYSQERMMSYFEELQRELGTIPGVTSVSMAELSAMTEDRWMSTVRVEGYEPSEDENMNPDFNGVGPDYFETMGIPILSGRAFMESDRMGARKVAVINETMAHYFFGDENPIGRRFAFGTSAENLDIEIIGVVADGKYGSLWEEVPRFGYIPYLQDERLGAMTFYVRAARDELALVDAVRRTVGSLDASLPIYDVKSMTTRVDDSLFVDRLIAELSATFGLVACLLASIGLYGVMSYVVTRRTREIGIRMALGAKRENVLGLVLKEVALLATLGVAFGLPFGMALARLIESQLFQISARDPLTWAASAVLLLVVALVSGFVPARRASRVDPLVALRWE